MLDPIVSAALAAGRLVVTPNNRMARALSQEHDRAMRAGGATAWTPARTLPWRAWLDVLWQHLREAGSEAALHPRWTPLAATRQWERIVDATSPDLFDPRGAAAAATGAWDIVQAYGGGGESWRGFAGGDADPAVFARWAERYHQVLGAAQAVDAATLPDALAAGLADPQVAPPEGVLLAGFVELDAQRQRLIAALAARGVAVERSDAVVGRATRIERCAAVSSDDELRQAFAWARARAHADPAGRYAVAIENLNERRARVRALADELLCPDVLAPGHEDAPRPYDLSLGEPLAALPLVAVALDLVAWSGAALPRDRAAAALRSPFLPGAEARFVARSAIERPWRELGRREVDLATAQAALQRDDDDLAGRLAAAAAPLREGGAASPRHWVERWRDALERVGWPGERALSSAALQARNAFQQALDGFARLDATETALRAGDAVAALRAHLAETLFQPEADAGTPIRILGLLEAAGLSFDGLWVAGLDAERWPPPPRPHPLLPLDWQRDRDAPHSSATRELAVARALTAQLLAAAPEVVLSYARDANGEPRLPSPLLDAAAPTVAPAPDPGSRAAAIRAARPAFDPVDDTRAPPLAAGAALAGGAYVVEAQCDCPFQGIVRNRLDVEAWPRVPDALTPMERGMLMHAAMAAFWSRTRGSGGLASLDDRALAATAAWAAREARRGTLAEARWALLPPAVAAGETARLARLVERFVGSCERGRPDFTVAAAEAPAALTLAELALRLRVDRIDHTAAGALIIDYKSSRSPSPATWFERPPRSVQLGLYALALRQQTPDATLAGLAIATVDPREPRFAGIALDPGAARGLKPLGASGVADDPDALVAWWHDALTAVVADLRDGVATVAPRDHAKTCERCSFAALCRIASIRGERFETDDVVDDENDEEVTNGPRGGGDGGH